MKDFLVCVDSDGCVFDGMTIKHNRCFGPALLDIWSLEGQREAVLNYWDTLNLYTVTRGINRFQGLLKQLIYMTEQGWIEIDVSRFAQWVKTTDELSAKRLEKELENNPDDCMLLAIQWSNAANRRIEKLLPSDILPFVGVSEVFAQIQGRTDIAIISSANKNAVMTEWQRNDLLKYVDVVMTQENGTKAQCIKQLKDKGYKQDRIIMIGDALGDLDAALENGILFYPIRANQEVDCWHQFRDSYFNSFIEGAYKSRQMQEQIIVFEENLKGGVVNG